jgi:hypothetical protein
MAVLVIDGMRVISGASWANRRARTRQEFFTLTRQNRQFIVRSTHRAEQRFLAEAEFVEFFRSTFGGWRAEVLAERAAIARREEAEREYDEAAAFNSFLDRVVASGVATQEEAIGFTLGIAREAAAVAERRGYERGDSDGYGRGYEERGGRDEFAVHGRYEDEYGFDYHKWELENW